MKRICRNIENSRISVGCVLLQLNVGIPLIKGGKSVEEVCIFSTNFPQSLSPQLQYQHPEMQHKPHIFCHILTYGKGWTRCIFNIMSVSERQQCYCRLTALVGGEDGRLGDFLGDRGSCFCDGEGEIKGGGT